MVYLWAPWVFHGRGTCFKIYSDVYSAVYDSWTSSLQSEKLPLSMGESETGTYEGCPKNKVTLWFSQKILIY